MLCHLAFHRVQVHRVQVQGVHVCRRPYLVLSPQCRVGTPQTDANIVVRVLGKRLIDIQRHIVREGIFQAGVVDRALQIIVCGQKTRLRSRQNLAALGSRKTVG